MLGVSFAKFHGKDAVVDANVIIDLSEIRALSLLNQIFASVSIPESIVQFELQTLDLKDISYRTSTILSSAGYELYRTLGHAYPMLSEYDRTLLTIAHDNGLLCVTNERPMRRVCEVYGLSYTGILGILGCSHQTGIISALQLKDLLDKLEKSSCYLGEVVLTGFREAFELTKDVV